MTETQSDEALLHGLKASLFSYVPSSKQVVSDYNKKIDQRIADHVASGEEIRGNLLAAVRFQLCALRAL